MSNDPANDNRIPHIESVPDLDELAFDEAAAKWFSGMMNALDRKIPIGRPYGMPAEKEPSKGYVYFRCGLRGKSHAEAQAQQLRAWKWLPAPKGTRFYGFESDGENGLYVYCRFDVYQHMHEYKNAARQMRALTAVKSAENLVADVNNDDRLRKAGVRAEVTSVQTGSATFDELAEQQRRPRANLRK
jgi:hypothetical protein